MLDVHDVLRAGADGRLYLQWQDEDGLIIGHVAILSLEEERIRFHSRLFGTRNVENSGGLLEVRIARRQAGRYWRKPVFLCPTCPRDANRLYYVRGSWRCKTCHDLVTITQRLDPINKAILVSQTLRAGLDTVPSTIMEQRKLDKQRKKYGAAFRTLADEVRRDLPANLTCRSIGRWLEPGEQPKMKILPDEVGYGWTPGMQGQLPGLAPPNRRLEPPSRPRPAAYQPTQAAGKPSAERAMLKDARTAAITPVRAAEPDQTGTGIDPGLRSPGYLPSPLETIELNFEINFDLGLLGPD